MKGTLYLFAILANFCAFSQQQPTEQAQTIVAEGKLLYYSEMASWHGNDLFAEKYKKDDIGGYFSYRDGAFSKCIFYSNADRARVIGTVRFDTTYNAESASLDLTERDFTPAEYELYQLRENALDEMDADTLFKSYPNTDLNVVPLINGNQKKVYVITASQQDSLVLLGNDYLLSFGMNNKLIAKKRLHQDLIPIYFSEQDGNPVYETMHTHLAETGDFITATDICTLMLYEKFTKWKMHRVNSKGFLNIWNCETAQLTVISKDLPGRTNKDLVRRSKKRGDPE